MQDCGGQIGGQIKDDDIAGQLLTPSSNLTPARSKKLSTLF